MRHISVCSILLVVVLGLCSCTGYQTRVMETTAYCGCGACCSWERGRWLFLKLDFWNRYVSAGSRRGAPYSGKTAANTVPVEPQAGLLSLDSLTHPWMIPVRLIFPWLWSQRDGTLAADTDYYPFGTRIHIPGYGWGVVTDRGGAIQGPTRLDLYFESHGEALQWGRKHLEVQIDW
ncbi:3D domain-containing protein [Desulfogranum mediterraneum]|uniref:3D domain-containing protein n=1 Tax=Desulfogranum mediterraneum TaxID=160661 RepID=UPI000558228E|nr:3D domain-containing protein [Desulfogranum mediterraneum]